MLWNHCRRNEPQDRNWIIRKSFSIRQISLSSSYCSSWCVTNNFVWRLRLKDDHANKTFYLLIIRSFTIDFITEEYRFWLMTTEVEAIWITFPSMLLILSMLMIADLWILRNSRSGSSSSIPFKVRYTINFLESVWSTT